MEEAYPELRAVTATGVNIRNLKTLRSAIRITLPTTSQFSNGSFRSVEATLLIQTNPGRIGT
jgi:hypothetical protein